MNFFKEQGVDPVAWNIIEYQAVWPVDERDEDYEFNMSGSKLIFVKTRESKKSIL